MQILSRRAQEQPGAHRRARRGQVQPLSKDWPQLIVEGSIPELLRGRRVVSLDLASMLAGAKYRGEFEERLKNAMAEIRKAGNVILFIDELHTIVRRGRVRGRAGRGEHPEATAGAGRAAVHRRDHAERIPQAH